MRPSRLLGAIAILWLTAAPGHSRVLHVPGEYPTIAAACNAAGLGDTVAVAPGSYYESVTIRDGISVIGTGAVPWAVLVEGNSNCAFNVLGGPRGVLVENIMLHGRHDGCLCVIQNSNGRLEVRDCCLDGSGIPGAFCVIRTFSDVTVRNCSIEPPPDGWGRGNPIHPEVAVDILAEDCFWGYEGIDWGRDVPTGTRFVFKNNTFDCCLCLAADPGQTEYSMRFINCIDYHPTCGTGEPPDTLEWRYCDFYCPTNPYPNCGTFVNCFSADPLFCDPESGDFRLQWGSPCIGAGEGGEDVGARLGYCNVPLAVESEPRLRAAGLWISNPWPNPTTGTTELVLRGHPGLPVDARIIGVDGSVVRDLALAGSGDLQRLTWDGLCRNGSPAPAGVYYLRIENDGQTCTRRLIVVR